MKHFFLHVVLASLFAFAIVKTFMALVIVLMLYYIWPTSLGLMQAKNWLWGMMTWLFYRFKASVYQLGICCVKQEF